MEETIVANEVSKQGLRYVKVMCGRAIDRKRWIRRVPFYARMGQEVIFKESLEKTLGMYYLELWWKMRERIFALDRWWYMWWIGNVEKKRDALPYAAVGFLEYFRKYPTNMWVNSLPENAPSELRIEDELDDDGIFSGIIPGDPLVVRVGEWGWIPNDFIVLG